MLNQLNEESKTFKFCLNEYLRNNQFEDEYEKRKIIEAFLQDKSNNLYNKKINSIEDGTNISSIKRKFDTFIHKYYHNRLKIANTIKEFLIQYYDEKTLNSVKYFENNERVLQLAKVLQGNKEKRLTDMAKAFNVSEETIKADAKKKKGRKNLNLKDGNFLGEKFDIVDRMVYGKRYYNRRTITPIFLNLGIGELYALLKVLCKEKIHSGGAGKIVYENLINKIYIQCSDYGKDIISNTLEKNKIYFNFKKDIKEQMKLEENFSDSWMNLMGTMYKLGNFKLVDIDGKEYETNEKYLEESMNQPKIKVKDKVGNEKFIDKFKIIDVIEDNR